MSSLRDRTAVLVAQQVLEQDLQRERQPRDVELRLQRVEPEDLVGLAADLEVGAGVEGVVRHACSAAGSGLSEAATASRRRSATSTGSEPPAGTRHDSVSGTAWPGLIVAISPIRRRSNFEPFDVHRPRVEAVREAAGRTARSPSGGGPSASRIRTRSDSRSTARSEALRTWPVRMRSRGSSGTRIRFGSPFHCSRALSVAACVAPPSRSPSEQQPAHSGEEQDGRRHRPPHWLGLGGVVNQVQPGGSGLSSRIPRRARAPRRRVLVGLPLLEERALRALPAASPGRS